MVVRFLTPAAGGHAFVVPLVCDCFARSDVPDPRDRAALDRDAHFVGLIATGSESMSEDELVAADFSTELTRPLTLPCVFVPVVVVLGDVVVVAVVVDVEGVVLDGAVVVLAVVGVADGDVSVPVVAVDEGVDEVELAGVVLDGTVVVEVKLPVAPPVVEAVVPCSVVVVSADVVGVAEVSVLLIVSATCASPSAVAGEAITAAEESPAPKARADAITDTRRPDVASGWQ